MLPSANLERPPIRRSVLVACAILVLFFGGLGSWAALSPLEGASVASGRITVASNRKTVQHLEGGMIKELLVREGERVAHGQVLVRLDDTQARATLGLLTTRHDHLRAREARLLAERDKAKQIPFPASLRAKQREPEIAALLASETALFAARRQARQNQIAILHQQIAQIQKEIVSLEAQVAATQTQLQLVEDTLGRVQILVNRGLLGLLQQRDLEREVARLHGSKGEREGLIARAQQRIEAERLQMSQIEHNAFNEVLNELKEVQANLAEGEERVKAADDVLRRKEITAPQAGTVVGLQVHTIGGVIEPGQRLMDIVPAEDFLVVEAQVRPLDIDRVHPGMRTQVHILAFKQRTTPMLEGQVTRVSADSFTDARTGIAYYLVQVVINSEQAVDMAGLALYPGMPAEVFIVTGKQTVLDYLVGPLKDSFRRAFR